MHTPRWIPKRASTQDEPKLLELKRSFGNLLGTALWSKGFEPTDQNRIEDYLHPKFEQLTSPWVMKNMSEIIARLQQALHKQERICIYADYDMDGMSGLCLLKSFLEACGFQNILPYQPDRLEEGYGVHPKALEEIHAQGVQLVVSVDTGTTAHEAALKCRELGMDFIITDHHQQVGELPDTPYILNPNQKNDSSSLGYLSGSGVVFYVCMALRQKLREEGYFGSRKEPDLRDWLDIFCLGTIGDVVDLVSSNRILIRNGIRYLAKTQRPGLKKLLEKTLSAESLNNMSARDVAFSVIPKLNAASRMGKALLSTKLLMTESPSEAEVLVEEILTLNTLRSQTQAQIFAEAQTQAEHILSNNSQTKILCLVGKNWHEGVLGIVASKIAESFDMPAIILTESHDQALRGSMRSRGETHCVHILEKASSYLDRFGGHKAAAGMQLKRENIDPFRKALQEAMTELYSASPTTQGETLFDGEIENPHQLNILEVQKMLSLEPFGAANPEPLFLLRKIPSDVFDLLKDVHIKAKRSLGTDMIGFQQASTLNKIRASGAEHVDLLVTPEINIFRNQAKVQLRIQHIRESVSNND